MSSETVYVPREIKKFNDFIILLVSYLLSGSPTNATRLGITTTVVSQIQAYLNQWNGFYTQYINRKGGYTTNIRNNLIGIIKNFTLFYRMNKVIDKVKSNTALTPDDCTTFHLPVGLSYSLPVNRSASSVELAERLVVTTAAVYPRLISEVGGFVKVKAYTEAARTGRAKKLKGFDLLEYAVGVFYSGTANLPAHPTDSRLTHDHSSRASFVAETTGMTGNLTALASGQVEPVRVAVFFFRWVKSKHPNQNGPWSGPFIVVLQ